MSLVASERSDRYCPISETSSVSPETVRDVAAAKLQLYEETLHDLLNQQSPDQLSGLYDMPSYDAPFVRNMLGLRGGGVKDFSDIAKTSANHEAICNAAIQLGFLHEELDNKLEYSGRQLDVALPRDMQPIGDVSAIIVPGGAGATNGIRLLGALTAIQEGKINTSEIILTTCDRPTTEAERKRAEAQGFKSDTTEFELCLGAAASLLGDISWEESTLPTPYESNDLTKVHQGWAKISTPHGTQIISLSVLSAPIDSNRTMPDGSKPRRANTQETFRAAFPLLDEGSKVAIVSHDTWIPYQELAGLDTFLLEHNTDVIAFGPQKTDRLAGGAIQQPEQVIDEIVKVYDYYVNLLVKAETCIQNQRRIRQYTETAIPDMTELRDAKMRIGYRNIPLTANGSLLHELHKEPLVDLASRGIAGRSYYSRRNATTGTRVPGVNKSIYIRESVARKLADINTFLQSPEVTKFFGSAVEVYAEEGLRSTDMQSSLYHQLIPNSIRRHNSDLQEDDIHKRRDEIIAKPSTIDNPSPHATGGAIDIRLRAKPSPWTPDFVADSFIDMGHVDGDTGPRNNPDYFEQVTPLTNEDITARRNRRFLYNLLTAYGFTVNPHEWWHFDYGDQLWAFVQNYQLGEKAVRALFGAADN